MSSMTGSPVAVICIPNITFIAVEVRMYPRSIGIFKILYQHVFLIQVAFCIVAYFFFQAEDGIRDYKVLEFRRVLFRSEIEDDVPGPRSEEERDPDQPEEGMQRGRRQGPHVLRVRGRGQDHLADPEDGPVAEDEIGRASCRERV